MFDLKRFRRDSETAYAETGCEVMDGTGFGLPLDANTVCSGQVQSNLVRKFGIMGAASGGSALWRL